MSKNESQNTYQKGKLFQNLDFQNLNKDIEVQNSNSYKAPQKTMKDQKNISKKSMSIETTKKAEVQTTEQQTKKRDSYLAPNFSNFKPSYILKHAIDPKNINDDNSKQSQKSAIIDIIYKQESSISIDNKKNLEINDTSNFVPNLNDDSKNALDDVLHKSMLDKTQKSDKNTLNEIVKVDSKMNLTNISKDNNENHSENKKKFNFKKIESNPEDNLMRETELISSLILSNNKQSESNFSFNHLLKKDNNQLDKVNDIMNIDDKSSKSSRLNPNNFKDNSNNFVRKSALANKFITNNDQHIEKKENNNALIKELSDDKLHNKNTAISDLENLLIQEEKNKDDWSNIKEINSSPERLHEKIDNSGILNIKMNLQTSVKDKDKFLNPLHQSKKYIKNNEYSTIQISKTLEFELFGQKSKTELINTFSLQNQLSFSFPKIKPRIINVLDNNIKFNLTSKKTNSLLIENLNYLEILQKRLKFLDLLSYQNLNFEYFNDKSIINNTIDKLIDINLLGQIKELIELKENFFNLELIGNKNLAYFDKNCTVQTNANSVQINSKTVCKPPQIDNCISLDIRKLRESSFTKLLISSPSTFDLNVNKIKLNYQIDKINVLINAQSVDRKNLSQENVLENINLNYIPETKRKEINYLIDKYEGFNIIQIISKNIDFDIETNDFSINNLSLKAKNTIDFNNFCILVQKIPPVFTCVGNNLEIRSKERIPDIVSFQERFFIKNIKKNLLYNFDRINFSIQKLDKNSFFSKENTNFDILFTKSLKVFSISHISLEVLTTYKKENYKIDLLSFFYIKSTKTFIFDIESKENFDIKCIKKIPNSVEKLSNGIFYPQSSNKFKFEKLLKEYSSFNENTIFYPSTNNRSVFKDLFEENLSFNILLKRFSNTVENINNNLFYPPSNNRSVFKDLFEENLSFNIHLKRFSNTVENINNNLFYPPSSNRSIFKDLLKDNLSFNIHHKRIPNSVENIYNSVFFPPSNNRFIFEHLLKDNLSFNIYQKRIPYSVENINNSLFYPSSNNRSIFKDLLKDNLFFNIHQIRIENSIDTISNSFFYPPSNNRSVFKDLLHENLYFNTNFIFYPPSTNRFKFKDLLIENLFFKNNQIFYQQSTNRFIFESLLKENLSLNTNGIFYPPSNNRSLFKDLLKDNLSFNIHQKRIPNSVENIYNSVFFPPSNNRFIFEHLLKDNLIFDTNGIFYPPSSNRFIFENLLKDNLSYKNNSIFYPPTNNRSIFKDLFQENLSFKILQRRLPNSVENKIISVFCPPSNNRSIFKDLFQENLSFNIDQTSKIIFYSIEKSSLSIINSETINNNHLEEKNKFKSEYQREEDQSFNLKKFDSLKVGSNIIKKKVIHTQQPRIDIIIPTWNKYNINEEHLKSNHQNISKTIDEYFNKGEIYNKQSPSRKNRTKQAFSSRNELKDGVIEQISDLDKITFKPSLNEMKDTITQLKDSKIINRHTSNEQLSFNDQAIYSNSSNPLRNDSDNNENEATNFIYKTINKLKGSKCLMIKGDLELKKQVLFKSERSCENNEVGEYINDIIINKNILTFEDPEFPRDIMQQNLDYQDKSNNNQIKFENIISDNKTKSHNLIIKHHQTNPIELPHKIIIQQQFDKNLIQLNENSKLNEKGFRTCISKHGDDLTNPLDNNNEIKFDLKYDSTKLNDTYVSNNFTNNNPHDNDKENNTIINFHNKRTNNDYNLNRDDNERNSTNLKQNRQSHSCHDINNIDKFGTSSVTNTLLNTHHLEEETVKNILSMKRVGDQKKMKGDNKNVIENKNDNQILNKIEILSAQVSKNKNFSNIDMDTNKNIERIISLKDKINNLEINSMENKLDLKSGRNDSKKDNDNLCNLNYSEVMEFSNNSVEELHKIKFDGNFSKFTRIRSELEINSFKNNTVIENKNSLKIHNSLHNLFKMEPSRPREYNNPLIALDTSQTHEENEYLQPSNKYRKLECNLKDDSGINNIKFSNNDIKTTNLHEYYLKNEKSTPCFNTNNSKLFNNNKNESSVEALKRMLRQDKPIIRHADQDLIYWKQDHQRNKEIDHSQRMNSQDMFKRDRYGDIIYPTNYINIFRNKKLND